MQSWGGVQQKRPSSLILVWGSGYCPAYPLHPQFHCEHLFQRAAGWAARWRAGSVHLHLDSKSWASCRFYYLYILRWNIAILFHFIYFFVYVVPWVSVLSVQNFPQGIVMYLWDWIPEDGQVVFVIMFGGFCYLLLFLARHFAGWVSNTIWTYAHTETWNHELNHSFVTFGRKTIFLGHYIQLWRMFVEGILIWADDQSERCCLRFKKSW